MGQAWVPVGLPDFHITKVIHSVEHIDTYVQLVTLNPVGGKKSIRSKQ